MMPDPLADHPAPPLVSVVIPTRNRSGLLADRALRTALSQTLTEIEVIVVIDGPDPATVQMLAAWTDPRLRVLALPESVGGGEARNRGIRAARAEWIALLDDDDEWMPHKLEQQLAVAQRSAGRVIVACPWIERTPRGDHLGPARPQDPGEPVGDYLLARRSARENACGLVSSLLFVSRDLLLDVPFDPRLRKHQDWDWLLRAAARPGVHLAFSPEVAAVWYYEEPRPSVSRQLDWRASRAWARGHLRRGTMSSRAYVGFLNSHVSTAAQLSGESSAVWPMLLDLVQARPRPFEWTRFLAGWVIPLEGRRRLRQTLERVWPRGGHFASPSSGRPQRRVTLIDPLDTGHHLSYAALLASGLSRLGWQVQIIGSDTLVRGVRAEVPQVRGDVLALYPDGTEAYYQLPRRRREAVNVQFFRRALKLAQSHDPQVIHLLYLDSYTQSFVMALASLRAQLGAVQVRATLHWLYFLRAYKTPAGHPVGEAVHLALVGLLGILGVRIMVHSRRLAGQLGARLPGLPLDVVPYFAGHPQRGGAQRAQLRRERRSALQLPEAAVVVLAFGGTRHDKGIDVAIRALASLPPTYQLLVVGPARAYDAQALADLAREFGVSTRVHFRIEYVPEEDVEGYFVAADCVVLPYRRVFAGQSGPLLIAASLGVPVVASDVGVLSETVGEYDLGLLCTPEDEAALAGALLQVPSLPARTQVERFQRDHSPEQFTQATVASYDAGGRLRLSRLIRRLRGLLT